MINVYEFVLKHEFEQAYILHKTCVMEFFNGDDCSDITVL